LRPRCAWGYVGLTGRKLTHEARIIRMRIALATICAIAAAVVLGLTPPSTGSAAALVGAPDPLQCPPGYTRMGNGCVP
jgi:hypothetical protein